MRRISSGQARLDAVLGGGLPENGINLVVGQPGSGKTILAQQFLFANASRERCGLFLSTVSEPYDKVLRYAESLDFFDPEAIGTWVLYADLGEVLRDGGLPAALAEIDRNLREQRPGVVVIDSFKALRAFSADEADFRRFLHDLAGRLSALATSAFWIGEYSRESAADAPEMAVADAIIALHSKRAAEREMRLLQVVKLRGSSFLSGEHAYRITSRGIDVFPRLADVYDLSEYALGETRVSTGIAALDEVLADGFWPGAISLIAGPTGVGKTLMGLHFLFNGAAASGPGILASFQENASQLARVASAFGWSFQDHGVHLMARSPVDLYLDEWVYELLDLVEATGARRVVIDSLGDLHFAAPDDTRFREMIFSLAQRFARQGVSLMMTLEVADLFGLSRISDTGLSYLADNVIVLQYVRNGSDLRRALIVLKTRASSHRPEVREFAIRSEGGIVLGDRVEVPPAP